MGIREKIERMKIREDVLNLLQGGALTAMAERDRTIDDVLSILDEHLGECVRDWHFTSHELALLEIWDGLLPKGPHEVIEFEPGDHISIYVRRKNESGS